MTDPTGSIPVAPTTSGQSLASNESIPRVAQTGEHLAVASAAFEPACPLREKVAGAIPVTRGPAPPTNTGQQLAREPDPPEFAEFDAIADMLAEAAKHSLQVEVVHSFGISRASGSDVHNACLEARYEWDI